MKRLRHLGTTITDQEEGNPRLFLTLTWELENRDFRAMVYYDLKRGKTYHESHKNLCEAFESIAPRKLTLIKCFLEFGFGRSHLNDDNRCGRPLSATTQENAASVKELIREDARITCKYLQDILGIGMSALNEILHQQLRVYKRCARWPPH